MIWKHSARLAIISIGAWGNSRMSNGVKNRTGVTATVIAITRRPGKMAFVLQWRQTPKPPNVDCCFRAPPGFTSQNEEL